MVSAKVAIFSIAAVATAGVITRPCKIPEAVWAVGGALTLVCCGLLPVHDALLGAEKGLDVYFFLVGMMLLAEIARHAGLFDWLASRAAVSARGSAARLFALIYAVGILVTVFLSNDATAVVLTPAVAAVARAAKLEKPLPYLFICAFIANAASFVLPISNPANLVIYGQHLPPLLTWLPRFALSSALSIGATFWVLRWTQRKALQERLTTDVHVPRLNPGGRAAALGILATALALMTASSLGKDLGLPTFCAGILTLALVAVIARSAPWPILKGISWSVIPLVAGLFVLVEALASTGAISELSVSLRENAAHVPVVTAATSGVFLALVSNLINNLPAGLIAGTAVQAAHVSDTVSSAILIGVDLGPNLSVTGSLATLLWLNALRRDGIEVKGRDFLKLGLLVMPPALVFALVGLLLVA